MDINVRTTTIKLLEEITGVNLSDLGLDNDFLDMTSKAQMTKEKIDWTATKFKTFMLQMTPSAEKDNLQNGRKH